jgi:hypothetical protein
MTYNKLNKIQGSVLILMLTWLVILIGMAALVIDIGKLRVAKTKAQNVADAGAMGGVHLLDGLAGSDTPAKQEAQTLALANNALSPSLAVKDDSGNNGATATVLPAGTAITITPGGGKAPYVMTVGLNQAIQVSCHVNVGYTFAPILNTLLGESGSNSGSANAVATAMWIGASKVGNNVMPWVMSQTQLWDANGNVAGVGTEFIIKVRTWKEGLTGPGNFQCVSYNDDSGANDYRKRIGGDPNVTPAIVSVGDVLRPENGNMVGPTDQGLKTRINDSEFATTTNPCAFTAWVAAGYPFDSRVVVVPVFQYPLPADDIKVVGFAAFFICKESAQGEVTGHFITARLDGGTLEYGGTNLSNTGSTTLITSVRLVK